MNELHLHLEFDEYVNDHFGEIKDFITRNKKVLLVAPPKSGKSKFFAEYAKHTNAIIIVPFNSLLTTYEHYGVEAIRSGVNTPDTLDENKPYAMVWNQAAAHISHNYMEQLENRVLLFDETHLLMLHKTFRDDILPSIDKLIRNADTVVLTTATECCEARMWNLGKIEFSRFTTPNEEIDIQWYENNMPLQSMELMINMSLNQYEEYKKPSPDRKVVVFTNRYAQDLFDIYKFCAYCRADNGKSKSNELGDRTVYEETLLHPLTIITDYGKFGINLRNPNDEVIVVVDMEYGEHTSVDLIQAVGRIREFKSLQVVVVYSAPRGRQKGSEQRFINNQALKRTVTGRTIITAKQRRQFKMLDKFIAEHSNYDAIKAEVEQFNGGQYKVVHKGGGTLKKMADEVRYREETRLRGEYMTQSSVDEERLTPRQAAWLDEIRELEYKDVPFKRFWALYCKSPADKPDFQTPIKYTPLSKIIQYAWDVMRIMSMNPNEWKLYKQEEEENINNVIAKGGDAGTVAKVRRELNYKERIRNEWILNKCHNAEDRWACMLNAEREFNASELEYAGKLRKQGNSKGGKVGGSKSKRNAKVSILIKETNETVTFESVNECCKYLQCSTRTFYKFKNGLSELNAKYTFLH